MGIHVLTGFFIDVIQKASTQPIPGLGGKGSEASLWQDATEWKFIVQNCDLSIIFNSLVTALESLKY